MKIELIYLKSWKLCHIFYLSCMGGGRKSGRIFVKKKLKFLKNLK